MSVTWEQSVTRHLHTRCPSQKVKKFHRSIMSNISKLTYLCHVCSEVFNGRLVRLSHLTRFVPCELFYHLLYSHILGRNVTSRGVTKQKQSDYIVISQMFMCPAALDLSNSRICRPLKSAAFFLKLQQIQQIFAAFKGECRLNPWTLLIWMLNTLSVGTFLLSVCVTCIKIPKLSLFKKSNK